MVTTMRTVLIAFFLLLGSGLADPLLGQNNRIFFPYPVFGTPGGGVPAWKRYRLSDNGGSANWYVNGAFVKAKSTLSYDNITLFSLPANSILEAVLIKLQDGFTATGGVTSATATLGSNASGNCSFYVSTTTNLLGTPSNTNHISQAVYKRYTSAADDVKFCVSVSGGSSPSVDKISDGFVDIWVKWSTLPDF